MKYTELKNDIAAGDRRIYLLEGDDAYFRSRGEEQIKSAFLELPELNFTSFDGASLKGASLTKLTAAMAAYPFMSQKRIIRAEELYPTEADYEKYLSAAFENCPPSTILMIVNSGAGKGVQLKRKKCVTYIDCSHADEDTVCRWVFGTLKRAGISADVQACRRVAAYCLSDMARVEGEVQKLIALGADTVTEELVDEVVYKDADYKIYEMTDAVAYKNYSKFIDICTELSAGSADRSAVMAALLRYFKNLVIIGSSQAGAAELAKQLKMPEFAVRRSAERARAFGTERLLSLTSALYELSARMRSGRLTPDGAFFCSLAAVLFGQ